MFKKLFKKKAVADVCGWGVAHAAYTPVLVVLGRECGHSIDGDPLGSNTVKTCQKHLEYFFNFGGVAAFPSQCPECGEMNKQRIIRVDDLD